MSHLPTLDCGVCQHNPGYYNTVCTMSLLLLPIMASLASGCAITGIANEQVGKPFIPVGLGTKWIYRCGRELIVDTITSSRLTARGYRVVVQRQRSDSNPVTSYELLISKRGLWRIHVDENGGHVETCWLLLPQKVGMTWNIRHSRNDIEKIVVSGVEGLKLASGEYNAIRVEHSVSLRDSTNMVVGNAKVKVSRWYADGVGLVKVSYPSEELVLVMFSPKE